MSRGERDSTNLEVLKPSQDQARLKVQHKGGFGSGSKIVTQGMIASLGIHAWNES